MPRLTWLTCGGMGYACPLKFLLWRNHMSGSTFKDSATPCKKVMLLLQRFIWSQACLKTSSFDEEFLRSWSEVA